MEDFAMTTKGSLLFVSAALATALAATPAVAAPASLEMTSYSSAPGGKEIEAGDYAGAIEAATRSVLKYADPGALVAATNLCVAYTKTGAFEKAEASCARALSLARSMDRMPGSRMREHTATSLALRNRGVLRAVSGDAMGAAADFRRASLRGDTLAAAARNLEHLETSPAYRLALAVTSN
jgi:hypothetical protein